MWFWEKRGVLYNGLYSVQTVLIWTHGIRLLGGESAGDYRNILKNPNIIATAIGLTLFLTKIRLPSIPASCIEGFGDMISPASMLVIGMIIGKVKLGQVFRKKRPYLDLFSAPYCSAGSGSSSVCMGGTHGHS